MVTRPFIFSLLYGKSDTFRDLKVGQGLLILRDGSLELGRQLDLLRLSINEPPFFLFFVFVSGSEINIRLDTPSNMICVLPYDVLSKKIKIKK